MADRPDALELAKRCALLLDEKKLQKIAIYDVARSLQITDYFVIASGLNPRHLRSASDHLVKTFRDEGVARSGLEGYREGRWILIDFDEVVVHLFLEAERRHYDLELLWGDCPRVEVPGLETAAGATAKRGAGGFEAS